MGWVSIIIPEATENIALNPSAEADGNYAANGATVTRDAAQAHSGNRSYKVVTSGTNQGVNLTTYAAANADHYVTTYVRGTVTGDVQVSMDGTNWNTATVVGGSSGGFVRYGVSIAAAQANASALTRVRFTANVGTVYVDDVLVEQKSGYFTTYGDGDQEGWRWRGLRHASRSTRDAQYRLGGRERDLLTDYAVTVRRVAGYGLPPAQNNVMAYTVLPGSEFQNERDAQRSTVLTMNFSATTVAALHSKRKQLINFVYPGAYAGAQEVMLGFKSQNASRTVYGKYRYVTGLEGQPLQAGTSAVEGDAATNVTFMAVDPYFRTDDAEAASLSFYQTVSNCYGAGGRINGVWQALDNGFDSVPSSVYSVKVDAVRGRVWYCGYFSTADGVTVNNICYWDGTQMVAVGGATKGVNQAAYDMAVMPNGDVWVVGQFTGAGGSTTKGIARWNNATDTFTVYNLTGTVTSVNSVVADADGNLFFGGDFTNWNGVAGNAYAVELTAAGTWTTLGTVPYGATEFPAYGQSIAVDSSGNLYFGSTGGASAPGHLRKFTVATSTWSDLGATSANAKSVYAVFVDVDDAVYGGGDFAAFGGVTVNCIFKYENGVVSALADGLAGASAVCHSIISDGAGSLIIGCSSYVFTTSYYATIVLWNGYAFSTFDGIAPSTGWVYTAVWQDDLYVGWAAASDGSIRAGVTTTVTTTVTAATSPRVVITGPTTADSSVMVLWLENQTSRERLYFNFSVRTGETVVIDFENLTVTSDWRGQLVNQPLEGSDWAGWHLLPGANVIAAFARGTTTGVTMTAYWPVVHNSIDGGAA